MWVIKAVNQEGNTTYTSEGIGGCLACLRTYSGPVLSKWDAGHSIWAVYPISEYSKEILDYVTGPDFPLTYEAGKHYKIDADDRLWINLSDVPYRYSMLLKQLCVNLVTYSKVNMTPKEVIISLFAGVYLPTFTSTYSNFRNELVYMVNPWGSDSFPDFGTAGNTEFIRCMLKGIKQDDVFTSTSQNPAVWYLKRGDNGGPISWKVGAHSLCRTYANCKLKDYSKEEYYERGPYILRNGAQKVAILENIKKAIQYTAENKRRSVHTMRNNIKKAIEGVYNV